MKLIDIYNNLHEDYPSEWDVEHFNSLKSYKQRLVYANRILTLISERGSGRHVFKIDDEKALKLSINPKGRKQTKLEIKYGTDPNISNVFAKVFNYDPKGYWVEMELARSISEDEFERMYGFPFYEFGYALSDGQQKMDRSMRQDYDWVKNVTDVNKIKNSDIYVEVLDAIKNNPELQPSELKHITAYGMVTRNGKSKLVIVDYGMSKDLSNNYR